MVMVLAPDKRAKAAAAKAAAEEAAATEGPPDGNGSAPTST
jgi:hypothetical protein